MKQKTILLQDAIRLFITETSSGKRRKSNGTPLKPTVIAQYQQVEKCLAAFELHSGKTFVIQMLHGTSAIRWNKEKRYWKKFFDAFLHYGRNKMNWTDQYLAGNLKVIKAVFNFLAQVKGYPVGNFHVSFVVHPWQPQPHVIMPGRLQSLLNNQSLSSQLKPSQIPVLDTIIIGCTVGLRYKDLMALKPLHLETTAICTYLCIQTSKTGALVRIPLPDYAIAILKKYQRKGNKWLLPQLSNNQFNHQMKEIGKMAGWTEEVPKYRSVKGRQTEIKNQSGKTWRFYEHLSAHTMRRTAITTLLLMGVDEAVVRTISGHAPGSKEFYRYVAYVQGYLDKQVINAHKLLLENPNCYME
jgi:integrase